MTDKFRNSLNPQPCNDAEMRRNMGSLTNVINEIYNNFELINQGGISVQENDGVPRVNDVLHLVHKRSTVEDLDGNAVRITAGPFIELVRATGSIAAFTSMLGTMASGSCEILENNGSGTLTPTNSTITAFNKGATAISSGDILIAHYAHNANSDVGYWYVDGDEANNQGGGVVTDPGGGGVPGGPGGSGDGDCSAICNASSATYQFDITLATVLAVSRFGVPISGPCGATYCPDLFNQTFRVTFKESIAEADAKTIEATGGDKFYGCVWEFKETCELGDDNCCDGIIVQMAIGRITTSNGVPPDVGNGLYVSLRSTGTDKIAHYTGFEQGYTFPMDCGVTSKVLTAGYGPLNSPNNYCKLTTDFTGIPSGNTITVNKVT